MFKICLLLTTPLACRVPVAMSLTLRVRWSSKIFGQPTFFRTTSPSPPPPPPPLNLLFQLFTHVLIKLCLGYFDENVLMAEKVTNISKSSFHIFWNLMLKLLKIDCLIFYLVCRKTQFSICDVFCDRANNICDCCIFIILRSVFFLFKISKKLFFVYFTIRLRNKNDK